MHTCTKKRILKCLWLLFLLPVMGQAQQISISGVVRSSADATPLIGARVTVKSAAAGAYAGEDGSYRIAADANAVLIFSYIGYKTLEVPVGGRTQIDVSMEEAVMTSEELVIVGYGTQRKSDLTGSVSSVKAEELVRIPTASLEQALQGKVAGVQVTPSSGQPGAGAVIRIRGVGTLNDASPLYVVDGLLLTDISFLSLQDVSSVEVLKDASATAIYGSRGANG
ncbi:MAG: hypothetical protein EAZ89_00415, partial [Bacteroidetes bacterium]